MYQWQPAACLQQTSSQAKGQYETDIATQHGSLLMHFISLHYLGYAPIWHIFFFIQPFNAFEALVLTVVMHLEPFTLSTTLFITTVQLLNVLFIFSLFFCSSVHLIIYYKKNFVYMEAQRNAMAHSVSRCMSPIVCSQNGLQAPELL